MILWEMCHLQQLFNVNDVVPMLRPHQCYMDLDLPFLHSNLDLTIHTEFRLISEFSFSEWQGHLSNSEKLSLDRQMYELHFPHTF